jgi:hypothetical protein
MVMVMVMIMLMVMIILKLKLKLMLMNMVLLMFLTARKATGIALGLIQGLFGLKHCDFKPRETGLAS